MKHTGPATESNMAALAARFAEIAGPTDEVPCVCAMLRVDEDEAPVLIAQGRRLLRLKREDAA
jgi:hypothetical protein